MGFKNLQLGCMSAKEFLKNNLQPELEITARTCGLWTNEIRHNSLRHVPLKLDLFVSVPQ